MLAQNPAQAGSEKPSQGKAIAAEMLDDLHLLEPFWRSQTVYRESVCFVQTAAGKPASAPLLFAPERLESVRLANGAQEFALGKDFTLSGAGQLALTEQSRIGWLKAAELFPAKGSQRSIGHKTGDPETNVLFENGHWFHDRQLEVTYVRSGEPWNGFTPKFAGEQLPKTLAKLRGKKPFVLAVSGDSISQGYNASGFSGAPPGMPPYPALVAAQLERTYGSPVSLHNRAISGWSVGKGIADLDKLLETKPDLILIAYGMNDVGGRNPEAFKTQIAAMLERIKAAGDAEVILVATMLGNAQWRHTPPDMFPKYRDALASLTEPGVALADLTSLWGDLLKRKQEIDLTGNGVNHPNDFGHRLYAQVILSLLIETPPAGSQ